MPRPGDETDRAFRRRGPGLAGWRRRCHAGLSGAGSIGKKGLGGRAAQGAAREDRTPKLLPPRTSAEQGVDACVNDRRFTPKLGLELLGRSAVRSASDEAAFAAIRVTSRPSAVRIDQMPGVIGPGSKRPRESAVTVVVFPPGPTIRRAACVIRAPRSRDSLSASRVTPARDPARVRLPGQKLNRMPDPRNEGLVLGPVIPARVGRRIHQQDPSPPNLSADEQRNTVPNRALTTLFSEGTNETTEELGYARLPLLAGRNGANWEPPDQYRPCAMGTPKAQTPPHATPRSKPA